MKSYSTHLFVALCALLAVPGGEAQAQGSSPIEPEGPQARLLVGPVLGVSRRLPSGGCRPVPAGESCPVFEQGSGWGFLAGMTAEILLGENWSLIPRLTYASRPGSFTRELPDALVLLPGTT